MLFEIVLLSPLRPLMRLTRSVSPCAKDQELAWRMRSMQQLASTAYRSYAGLGLAIGVEGAQKIHTNNCSTQADNISCNNITGVHWITRGPTQPHLKDYSRLRV